MAQASASVDIPASPDSVWQRIRGFGSLPDWLPYIPSSELSEGGVVRRLANPDGDEIVERLMAFDEADRSYSYAILRAPFPVTGYRATLRVQPSRGSAAATVRWSGEFTPSGVSDADATRLFQGIYEEGLRALAAGFAADSGPSLFSPLPLGALAARNRIVMAPLTRSRASADGVPSAFAADYYRQRASAGLIISEATNISRQARGYAFTPGIYTADQISGWRQVTAAVHKQGGKIFCQLWHVGRMSHTDLQEGGAAPVAPSAIQAGETIFLASGLHAPPSMPRALETEEIASIVDDYRHAARCALDAGFDGVEIHSANCYLLEQFVRDSTNRRTDRYGGSLENRVRLPLEVCEAVAGVWGADRVGIRLSPLTRSAGNTPLDSHTPATYGYYAAQLGRLKLAYLHCVEGQTRGHNGARDFDFKALHAAFGGRYIANNSYTRQMAMEAVASGYADMVSFGRPFIGNPDLVERLRRDAPLATPDAASFYGGGAKGYTDYPALEAPAEGHA